MNIVIVGLGAIGGVYATAFHHHGIPLRVAMNQERLVRYGSQPFIFNGREYEFDYFDPSCTKGYQADLIIITTKWAGYREALEMIRPIVGAQTIILPLLNGISSESAAAGVYGWESIMYGYFIGHTSTREATGVSHDGEFVTVLGKATNDPMQLDEQTIRVKELFERAEIPYRIDPDMVGSLWAKYVINIGLNQSTAYFRANYGEIKKDPAKVDFTRSLMREATLIAQELEVANHHTLLQKGMDTLAMMRDEDSSSMRQDVEAQRATEIDLFAKEICRLGKQLNISTPCNQMVLERFEGDCTR